MGIFKFRNAEPQTAEATILRRPYCLTIEEKKFIETKTRALFERILKRCYHKTAGIDEDESDKIALSMFLSVEYGAQKNGTIPLVAQAMTSRTKLYLVYDKAASLVRKASIEEQEEIIKNYNSNNNILAALSGGKRGMALDFTQFNLSLLVKCYMALIYAVMDSGNTQVNMARSIQIKIDKLRENISVLTSEDAKAQASEINDALKNGRSVLLSSTDNVIQTAINATSIKDALEIFYTGLASDLGLSLSFVSGELTSGMSATGDADINYEDTGIRDYWSSIWRPIMIKLYGQDKVKFKTDRWRNIGQKLQNLIMIENSELFTDEQKKEYAAAIIDDEL